jgi:hypothetical protein
VKREFIKWAVIAVVVCVAVWFLKGYVAKLVAKDTSKVGKHPHSKGSTWAPSLVDGPSAELAQEWPGAVGAL